MIDSLGAVFAGLMVSTGSVIYLNCPNKIVGAFLFSIGLVAIFEYKFKLYTGKIGGVRSLKQLGNAFFVLIGNAFGALSLLAFPENSGVWATKIIMTPGEILPKAIMCGMLIQICVTINEKHDRLTTTFVSLVAISAFILGGADHCVADICFMVAARSCSWEDVTHIVLAAMGNGIGAYALSIWNDLREKK